MCQLNPLAETFIPSRRNRAPSSLCDRIFCFDDNFTYVDFSVSLGSQCSLNPNAETFILRAERDSELRDSIVES